MLQLHAEVSVYVCCPEQVSYAIRYMVKRFGGATVTQSQGFWEDPDTNTLHTDNTTIVSSSTDQETPAQALSPLLEWLFANSSEKAISVKTSWEGLCIFDRSDFLAVRLLDQAM